MQQERIAFVIHSLVVGGAEKFLISVANNFQLRGQRPFVVLLGNDNPLLPELNKEIEYVIIERKSKYDFSVGKRLKLMLIERNIEKIFCVNTFSFFMVKSAFLFDRKFKFYLSLHSTIPKSAKDYLQNFVYLKVISKRDLVIYICEAQKKYHRKYYAFWHKKDVVVYNGIDTSYFSQCDTSAATKEAMREKTGIPAGEKVIVKLARLAPEKGHQYAIKALQVLHNKYKVPAYLLIVGSGDNDRLKNLKELAKQCQIEQYVKFVKHQKDVRPFHCMSDVFTLTSYSIETFSLAALEAMSSGIPCVLTNIGGAAEMINSQTGALCIAKDEESIASAWKEVLEKKFEGAALHNYVESNFSLTKMLKQYEELL